MRNEQSPHGDRNFGRREEAYWRALDQCSQVARDEFDFAHDAFQHATPIGVRLRTAVRRAARRGSRDGTAIEDARAHLQELEARLEGTLVASLSSGQAALRAKKAALDSFTVALFGRTMAGKSTIREALTRGDGSTIGKGAQRTTRDVREYDWNALRVIDTPGIGAYDGDEDHVNAMSVIEETDLVLFLISSDGLQQDVFEGIRKLRDQNKGNYILDVTRPYA